MNAVIIGGTGLVGSFLSQKLLEDPDISELISISRKPLPYKNPKLKELIVPDLSQLPSEAAKLKADLYFCCLGTTIKDAGSQSNFEKVDYHSVMAFAKIAQNHRAKCFSIISAYGADSKSRIFYNRVKGRVEEELKQMKFNRLVIFKPSLLMGRRKNFRLGEKVAIGVVGAISFALPGAIKKRLGTDVELLASKLKGAGMGSKPGVFVFEAFEI